VAAVWVRVVDVVVVVVVAAEEDEARDGAMMVGAVLWNQLVEEGMRRRKVAGRMHLQVEEALVAVIRTEGKTATITTRTDKQQTHPNYHLKND
jgi:hypothetical protein